jgi:hypothetical protein
VTGRPEGFPEERAESYTARARVRGPAFTFRFDGAHVPASPGQTVAAALWAAGVRSWRTTRGAGAPRGLFCGIGVCFDCLITVDGEPNQRACLVPARPDQIINTQTGAGHR